MGWLFACITGPMYLLSNHFPIFTPQLLPMTWIDRAVPFVPQTIFIYMSEYALFISVYLLAKDMKNLNKYLYSFFCLQATSVIIFIFFPTTYPRELFPLPTSLDPFTFHVFSSLRVADSPNSCLPSLHVSSCYLSSFVYLDEQRKKFPIFFLWATAVGVSTLTTKQHYIVDVISGFILASFFYFILHRYVPYREWKKETARSL